MVKKMSMEKVFNESQKVGKQLCEGCAHQENDFDEEPCDQCFIKPSKRKEE